MLNLGVLCLVCWQLMTLCKRVSYQFYSMHARVAACGCQLQARQEICIEVSGVFFRVDVASVVDLWHS